MFNWLTREIDTLRAYARGLAGGIIFGMPLLYTMEMWWLGFYLSPEKLLIALAANFCVLLVLERFSGFREDTSFMEEVQDAIVALGLGMFVSVVALALLNVLRPGMGLYEFTGKVIMQTIAVSIGISVAMAMLGESQQAQRREKEENTFWGNQAESVAGAVFLALNVAATEEPLMIGMQMRPAHSLALLIVSLLLVFAVTYALQFRGGIGRSEKTRWWNIFLRDSISTYTTALLIAAGALLLFGRIDLQTGILPAVQMVVALGFATALGASFARLLI